MNNSENINNYEIINENINCTYYKIKYNGKDYFAKYYKILEQKNMFYNEINILKALSGLNVPKIINYNKELRYIIYDYILGKSINNIKITNIEYINTVFIKILDVVSSIHQRGIIHCDLKPDNIILTKDDIYIIDFGISCKK